MDMTLFEIVALYVALNLLLLFALTFLVIRQRRHQKIGFGHQNNEDMQRAIRVHGNFTEYTPLALLGLLMMATLGASVIWLHGIGILFTLGRILHAFGYSKSSGISKGRFYGIIFTATTILIEALYLLFTIIM
jgi:uncharacterized membrane protein YecN with MAPEG domain